MLPTTFFSCQKHDGNGQGLLLPLFPNYSARPSGAFSLLNKMGQFFDLRVNVPLWKRQRRPFRRRDITQARVPRDHAGLDH